MRRDLSTDIFGIWGARHFYTSLFSKYLKKMREKYPVIGSIVYGEKNYVFLHGLVE